MSNSRLTRRIVREVASHYADDWARRGLIPYRWRDRAILVLSRNRTVMVNARVIPPLKVDRDRSLVAGCYFEMPPSWCYFEMPPR